MADGLQLIDPITLVEEGSQVCRGKRLGLLLCTVVHSIIVVFIIGACRKGGQWT